MAHELEFANGTARMFSVVRSASDTPWHKEGVYLDSPPTVVEAMAAAQMNYTVDKLRLHLPDHQDAAGTITRGRATDVFSLVRSSDGKILSGTGTVTKVYSVLQPAEAFQFFQPFLDAGEASLETAGVLRDGQVIWALAKLNRDPSVIVGDDVVQKYILLSNSYDGKSSIRCGFSPVRVVCANTLAMAVSDSGSALMKVKHSTNMHENLEKVREIMNAANAKFEASAEQYRFLASRQISKADLDKYVEIVFTPPKAEVVQEVVDVDPVTAALARAGMKSDKVEKETRTEKFSRERADIIKHLFEKGKGNDMAGVKGTHWAAYNAVTEYLTHMRPRMDRSDRLESLTFGTKAGGSAAISGLALGVALQLASAA